MFGEDNLIIKKGKFDSNKDGSFFLKYLILLIIMVLTSCSTTGVMILTKEALEAKYQSSFEVASVSPTTEYCK